MFDAGFSFTAMSNVLLDEMSVGHAQPLLGKASRSSGEAWTDVACRPGVQSPAWLPVRLSARSLTVGRTPTREALASVPSPRAAHPMLTLCRWPLLPCELGLLQAVSSAAGSWGSCHRAHVCRCSWFCRSPGSRPQPLEDGVRTSAREERGLFRYKWWGVS